MDEKNTAVPDERPPGFPSELDSVVVYAAGAVCRRRARVSVPADGRLRLTGLPKVLDARSLRARVVRGPDGLAVTEARLEPVAAVRARADLPEIQRLSDEAWDREDAARERLERNRKAAGAVAALRAVPPPRHRDEPHRRTPAEAWLELAEFVDERLTVLHERGRELARELERATHEAKVLSERLARALGAERAEPVETSATVLLTLTGTAATGAAGEAGAADEVELELEYGVPTARWLPAYRLSYRRGDDTGRLVLRASVAQRTGEDWTGVRLALSTADLQRRTDLPKLRSLRIGRSQPAPAPSGWREPPEGLADLFTGYETAGPRPVPVASRSAGRRERTGQAAGAPVAVAAPVAPLPPSPVPSPPPMPAAPGGPFAGYGAPPAAAMPAPGGPPPKPMAARSARPGGRPRGGGGAPQGFAGAPDLLAEMSVGAAPGFEPAPAGPPVPDATLLDYPALVLAGAEAGGARRGRLHPDAAPPAAPAAGLDLPIPRYCVPPRISAGSFDHRFDATAPADIPSDGVWHTVTVTEIPVSLRPEYLTVPSVEEKVYGTLLVANSTAQAILAGPVEVTVDGEFLLTAGLPTLAPGGVRRLGLGVTESIEVARRTELRESTAGMLNSSTVLDHRVHVELANRLGHPVTVEVRERVPVTSDAEVRIEERADWRAPAEPSPEVPASTRIWRVELPPGGRAELHGGFEIRIPAGKAIVGGNRRN